MRLSMSVFPSLRPPLYSNESHGRRNPSLLDHEAGLAQDKRLEQWKESLHRSPYPTPLGLTKEDYAVLLEEDGEEVEEGGSAELDSEGSFRSTASLGSTVWGDDDVDDNLNASSLEDEGAL
ncbi:hypothetical protein GBAR_LOCUS20747 [Geodia barretti]|uniref:Uncharacterized protein n=1 Tax=Geodia barretti TaxID=519541 RepID=A0AA35SYH4_GEOBA|nr:hypothetical protein GBAR_LOCUS20747 [Geodia barretti]